MAGGGEKGEDILVEHVGDHFDFGLGGGDLLRRAGLRALAEEEGHCCGGLDFRYRSLKEWQGGGGLLMLEVSR